MRNIKLTIAYDGSDFQGWQIQKSGRTVQGEIQKGLTRMHKSEIKVHCAGRTDSGVHANGQVINFRSNLEIPVEQFTRAVSSFLPKDISVIRSEEVDESFHARYSAVMRHYKYYIFPSRVRVPQYRLYSLRTVHQPDLINLNRMASVLVGEHDFTTFSTPNEQVPNRMRRIYSASFHPQGDFLVFRISGNAFLWKMVRSIVGSLLEYDEKGLDESHVREALESRNREWAGMTAQARGLFFDRVDY